MAAISVPVLTITPGAVLGEAIVNVKYGALWDKYDVASDQPYTVDIYLMGDDTGTGDGAGAGLDDPLWAWEAAARYSLGTSYSHTTTVPILALNEDTGTTPNPDEIIAVVTLTPDAPKQVGPIESTRVTAQL